MGGKGGFGKSLSAKGRAYRRQLDRDQSGKTPGGGTAKPALSWARNVLGQRLGESAAAAAEQQTRRDRQSNRFRRSAHVFAADDAVGASNRKADVDAEKSMSSDGDDDGPARPRAAKRPEDAAALEAERIQRAMYMATVAECLDQVKLAARNCCARQQQNSVPSETASKPS